MKYYKTLIFTFLIVLTSFITQGQQPDNTKPMYGEVSKSEKHNKIDENFRIECLSKYKTIDSSVNVYIDLAWRYFYNNDLQTSMKRFNQAWLLNPDFSDSYFGFAALMEIQGNITESERLYNIGKEKDSNNKRAIKCYQRIADCKEQLKDINGTIEAYKHLIDIDPKAVFALKKIGYLQMQKGNNKEALIAYGKAIELDSTDAMTYNNRGFLYQTEKNYISAIIDYTKAIELDPNYISAYVNRGLTLMEEKNYEAAKKDFEICVQLDNTSGELRRFLGKSKLKLNDKSGACSDFELAKKLGDEFVDEFINKNCK